MIDGIQLLRLGFIGEYIGKICFKSNRRLRFIVETHMNDCGAHRMSDGCDTHHPCAGTAVFDAPIQYAEAA